MRRPMIVFALALALTATALPVVAVEPPEDPDVAFRPVGTYDTGLADIGQEVTAAETVAVWEDRLYVTNATDSSLDIVDWSDPTDPVLIERIDLSPYGAGPNSVAAGPFAVAVAVEADPKTDPGTLVFFSHDGDYLTEAEVGALPDMVTFTPDGRSAVVANEGEPNDEYTIDPLGTVSIVSVNPSVSRRSPAARRAIPPPRVRTIDFTYYDVPGRVPDGVRIFGPGASPSQDLEPEYIAITEDGRTAYVTLQENNALAVIDLRNRNARPVLVALGTKDHSLDGNGLDPSDRDDAIAIGTWPVEGMYQPDAIAAFSVGRDTYVVTANEGDARDYGDAFSEEERLKDLDLDPTVFPDAVDLQEDEALGRLTVTTTAATNDLGEYTEILAYGARSFSIWSGDGALVWDSGDQFEQIVAGALPEFFNATNDENEFDNRSDNKGPEPEGVAVGEVDGRTLAFIGLERIGGVMIYDVGDPTSPEFLQYTNNRDFTRDPGGDLGPEVLAFVEAGQAPNGVASLMVANEVSGTVTIYQAHDPDGAGALTLLHNNDGESSLLPLTNDVGGTPLPVAGVAAFATVTDQQLADARGDGRAVVTVYAGDAFLASSTLACSLPPNPPGTPVYDAEAQKLIPYDAHILGNHEFDFGPDFLERFIRAFDVNGVLTQPFLSANLGFSGEPGFSDLIDADGLLPGLSTDGRVVAAASIVTDPVDGQRFGIVGVTTPLLRTISSPGNVEILSTDLPSTAAVVQEQLDRLRDLGIEKIVFVSHLQDLANDQELIPLLEGVDLAVAGGGDELLANSADQLLPGEQAAIAGPYPLWVTDGQGRDIPIVTTAGNYTYLGRLDVVFDDDGEVVEVEATSFPRRVIPVSPEATGLGIADAVTPDPEVVEAAIEPVKDCLAGLQEPLIGTEVLLDTSRAGSRGAETNTGNLVTDSYLAAYDTYGPAAGLPVRGATVIAVQNGGGIRQNAGDVLPVGGGVPGVITRANTLDTLSFLTNVVAVVEEVTPEDLKQIFERSGSGPGGGQFLQVAGVEVVYDLSQTAQAIQTDGTVTTPGERVVSLVLTNGTADTSDDQAIVSGGDVVAGAPDVTIVTNSFTAAGGDNYPWLGSNTSQTLLPATYEQAWVEYMLTFPVTSVAGPALPTIPGNDPRYAPGGEGRISFLP